MTIKVAVVGIGKLVKILPGVEVVDNLKKFYGIDLDAICTTTPPGSHSHSII